MTGLSFAAILALAGCVKSNMSTGASSIQSLEVAAERGNAAAANDLGVAYANGNGVPQDFSQARKWYLFAADHGNAAGEMNLAYAYEQGQGTQVDMAQAISWYTLAVNHNFAPAMLSLGLLYRDGKGVPRDHKEATRLIRISAIDGYPLGQAVLAALYLEGVDVEADDGLAYEWASIAAAKMNGPLVAFAKSERDSAEKGLTPAELTVAQTTTARWTAGADLASPLIMGGGPRPTRLRSQGSGFVVGRGGQIATDFHVVPNCREVRLKDAAGKFNVVSHVVAEDRDNDLALISGGGFGARLKIADSEPKLGETIVTFGFPLGAVLSGTGNMTTGSVSSVAGMQEDTKLFQMTAPVQAGSSGGPVVNESGALIGLVESKLNALAMAAATGDLSQNVNFAKRTGPLRTLLAQRGIAFDQSGNAPNRSMSELADALQNASVKIECWR